LSARPKVSLIIPTKNRRADLEETIRTVLAQTCSPDELVVVDQSDAEMDLRTSPLALQYIYNPRITGLTQARNEGMKRAVGDIWLFLDDDVALEPDFIEKLLVAYTPAVTGVSGIITNYSAPPALQRIWTAIFQVGPFHDERQAVYYNAGRLAGGAPVRVRQFGGGLMSFRADKIRGRWFDENLSGACLGEDLDFCVRLPQDSVLLITPRARLVHKHSPEARQSVHWLDLHAQAASYMRQRHWRRGLWNNLCFVWLNLGYALAAALSSVHRMSLEPWKAWMRGAKRGRLLGGDGRAK
jgi:GT2 family glycosyltransferase